MDVERTLQERNLGNIKMNEGILINPNDVGNKIVEIPAQKVAVRTGEDFSKKDFISPEEFRIGQIGNIARRKLWRIPVEFRIMDSENDRWLTAVSLCREMRVVSPQRQPNYREQQVGQLQRQDVRQEAT